MINCGKNLFNTLVTYSFTVVTHVEELSLDLDLWTTTNESHFVLVLGALGRHGGGPHSNLGRGKTWGGLFLIIEAGTFLGGLKCGCWKDGRVVKGVQ